MGRESREQQRVRAREVVAKLRSEFPSAETALLHRNDFELLVATILSAQCTDVLVNKVTPALFERAPDARALAELDVPEIEELIRKVNFFRNKAKNLKACAERLVSVFDGKVPETLEDLVSLPGVGRKTANVVLTSGFDTPAMVVDTHVLRLSNRLRFSRAKDPVKVEADLERVFDREVWVDLSHLLILHGRKTCKAQRPRCAKCSIQALCPSAFKDSDAWKSL